MISFYISATNKSSGKTTITIGLIYLLKKHGLSVQVFKKGPDYIDPQWHKIASGNSCYNLDFFTQTKDEIEKLFTKKSENKDAIIIEGNKGLYDGLDKYGSDCNAALAKLLNKKIILVINCSGTIRGIAPLINGYIEFDKEAKIAAVILNNIRSRRHENKIRDTLELYCKIPVIGAFYSSDLLSIKERHLGLVPGNEHIFSNNKIENIGKIAEKSININDLLTIFDENIRTSDRDETEQNTNYSNNIKLAIAFDSAFNFYYADDLDYIESKNIKLIFFSPLNDKELPNADGYILGGGFPEEHIDQLTKNKPMMMSIYNKIESGYPFYAECGGLMYLTQKIIWNNKHADMVGAIKADVIVEKRPIGRGYVIVEDHNSLWSKNSKCNNIHGHEFHHSRLIFKNEKYKFAWKVKRGYGIDGKSDGLIYKNLLAGYFHQRHTLENPWIDRFIDFIHSLRK